MNKGDWRVGTRHGIAYACNYKTGERIGCWPLWGNESVRFNCERFSTGYQKAQAECDRLNKEQEQEHHGITQQSNDYRQPDANCKTTK